MVDDSTEKELPSSTSFSEQSLQDPPTTHPNTAAVSAAARKRGKPSSQSQARNSRPMSPTNKSQSGRYRRSGAQTAEIGSGGRGKLSLSPASVASATSASSPPPVITSHGSNTGDRSPPPVVTTTASAMRASSNHGSNTGNQGRGEQDGGAAREEGGKGAVKTPLYRRGGGHGSSSRGAVQRLPPSKGYEQVCSGPQ